MTGRLAAMALVLASGCMLAWLMLADEATTPGGSTRAPATRQSASSTMAASTSTDDASGSPRAAIDDAPRQPIATPAVAGQPSRSIVGRVIDPDGDPVPRAVVAMIPLLQGDPARGDDNAVVRCDEDGRFALEPPELAAGQEVALVARAQGWRPATQRWFWSGAPGGDERVLQLEDGFTLAGRVVRDGHGIRARLSIDLRFGTAGVFGLIPDSLGRSEPGLFILMEGDGLNDEAFWIGGRLEEKVASVEADDAGAFRITGLGPYDYRLAIAVDGGPSHVGERVRRVTSPDEGLLLDVSDAEVEVRASSSGADTAGMVVHVRGPDGRAEFAADDGSVTFAATPGTELAIAVEHPRCQRIERTITTPGPGQRTVVDVPLALVARPSLRLRLDGASAAGIGHVQLRWTPTTGGDTTEQAATRNLGTDSFDVATVPLDPGEYRLIVGPTDGSDAAHYLLPVQTTLQLPADGLVTVELTAVLAGRIQLEVDDPGRHSYHATVRDRAGDVVLQMHHRVLRTGGGISFSFSFASSGPEDADGIRRRERMVAPGRYRLTVEADGCRPVFRDVDVVAGETTLCKLPLTEVEPR